MTQMVTFLTKMGSINLVVTMTMMVTTILVKRTSTSSPTISNTINLTAREAANLATYNQRKRRTIMRMMKI